MGRPQPLEPQQERSVATRARLLDASVDELVESGYARFTTSAVALRAGLTRGAQQHHFPSKEVLVAAAVRHLGDRQSEHLLERVAAAGGVADVERSLDALFDAYRGPLFAVSLELAVAARTEPSLATGVAALEDVVGRKLHGLAMTIFGPRLAGDPRFAELWALTLATMRGLAMLRLFGYRDEAVDRHWAAARTRLVRMVDAW